MKVKGGDNDIERSLYWSIGKTLLGKKGCKKEINLRHFLGIFIFISFEK